MKNYLYYIYWLIRTWPMRWNFPKYQIMTIEETIDDIIQNKKSISRLGDADFLLLVSARDVAYQKLTPEITNKLKEVLKCRDERFLIALPDSICTTHQLTRSSKVHWKMFINTHGKELRKYFDINYRYGNSYMTRLYMDYFNKSRSSDLFNKLKTIWQDRDVVIVEGEFTRLGVGNDLLENARSVKRIIAPYKNAFQQYGELKTFLLTFSPERTLFLFSLGPTATILCHELSLQNYWSVDIGNVDLEYMWMRMDAKQKISVQGRYSVETGGQRENLELNAGDRNKYMESIIADFT